MSIRVNVAGRGTVSFPDGTSNEDIEKAIKEWQPEEGPKAETPGALETAGRTAALGVAPTAAAAAAFAPSAAVGEFIPLPYGLGPLVTGLAGSAGAGLLTEMGQQKLLQKIAPGFLERTAAGEKEHPVAGAAGRVASTAAGFEFSPGTTIEGLAAIPAAFRGNLTSQQLQAARALAAQVGTQAGITAAQTGIAEHRLPNAKELLEGATSAALFGHPRFGLPIPAFLKKGGPADASKISETTEVHGDVRTQPGEGAREVPPEVRSQRVRPRTEAQAEGLEGQAQVLLDPNIPHFSGSDETGWTLHMQGKVEPGFRTKADAEEAANQTIGGMREMVSSPSLQTGKAEPVKEPTPPTPEENDLVARMEREAIDQGEQMGTPVKTVDSLEGIDAPFAKDLTMVATGKGALLHRGNFKNWILNDLAARGFSEEQIKAAIRSHVGEEMFHNKVIGKLSDTEVGDYWRSLSGAEKNIERYIYTGRVEGRGGLNDTHYGHESIRRRMQQAAGMTPSEFTEVMGKEKVTLKTLDALSRIIRRSREAFSTTAARRGKELYDRALSNIDFAKAALGGRQLPASLRREQSEPVRDRLRYKDIQTEWKTYSSKKQFPPQELWKEMEALKNKYKGMPPPEILTEAAYITPEGKKETGPNHPAILERLGIKGFETPESRNTPDFGFVTDEGKFVTREQAGPIATKAQQNLKDFEPGEPVHSDEVKSPTEPGKPISETGGKKDVQLERSGGGMLDPEAIKGLSDDEILRLRKILGPRGDVEEEAREALERAQKEKRPLTAEEQAAVSRHGEELLKKVGEAEESGDLSPEQQARLERAMAKIKYKIDEGFYGSRDLPGSLRRGKATQKEIQRAREEAAQSGMFGASTKGLGSSIPPTPPEQREVPSVPPPTSIAGLENAAEYFFSGFNPPVEARTPGEGPGIGEATEPTFENFLDWAKRNVSETIESGPLFSIWLNTVNKNIERAPGPKLNEMVEKLGVESRVYPWKRKLSTATMTPIEVPPGAPGKVFERYQRIDIPDFREVPPDPNQLPMQVVTAIRERVDAMEPPRSMTDEQVDRWREIQKDKLAERARKDFMGLVDPEERARLVDERERIARGQRLRNKAISAIFQKIIAEGAPNITDLTPNDITVEDLAWNNPNAKQGVYRTIRPSERLNPEKLRQIFADEARRNSFDPVSWTRRLAVMRNKNSGEVALVSVYPVPLSRGGLRVIEPSGATGVKGKPNVAMDSAMRRGWEPIISVLRREPLKDFYKNFKDIEDFNRYLGHDAAREDASSVYEIVGSGEGDYWQDVPEWQALAYASEPVEQDVVAQMQEARRPAEEFQGPMPGEQTGETFRPGTRVTQGEGGSYVGPYAGQFRQGRGDIQSRAALTPREALALREWINNPDEARTATEGPSPELANVTTKEGMRDVLQRLVDLAKRNELKPRQFNAIIAMRKAAAEQLRRDRAEFRTQEAAFRRELGSVPQAERQARIEAFMQNAPTPESAMTTALDHLYEINQSTKDEADYLAEVMGQFARPTPKPETPTAVPSPQAAPGSTGPVLQEPGLGPQFIGPQRLEVTGASAAGVPRGPAQGIERELTMLQRRPPTSTTWQGPPVPEKGTLTEPTPPELLSPDAVRALQARAAVEMPYEPTPETPPEEFKVPSGKGRVVQYRMRPEFAMKRKGFAGITEPDILGPLSRRELPGSIRRNIDQLRKEFEELQDQGKALTAPFTRMQSTGDLYRTADGADRLLEVYSNRASNDIRIASLKVGEKPTKPTPIQRFFGGLTMTKEARMIRRAAKAVIAAHQFAVDDSWRDVYDKWAELWKEHRPELEEAKRRHKKRPEIPEEKHPKFVPPTEIKPEHFDRVMALVDKGLQEATRRLQSMDPRERRLAKAWVKAAKDLKEEVAYAKAHHKDQEMVATVQTFQNVMKAHLDNMNKSGVHVLGRDDYVPGRYEGELWNDYVITFGGLRILGKQFRLPKSFRNYYHAISEGPYIAVNGDVADLAQHSLASGGRLMARELWLDSLKSKLDPVSQQPIAIEPQWEVSKPAQMSQAAFDEWYQEVRKQMIPGQHVSPETINQLLQAVGVTGDHFTWAVPKGKLEYELLRSSSRSKPLAIRKSYVNAVRTSLAESVIRDIPVLGQALTASQMLKHGAILILDTFHPGRLAQYGGALAGKNLWGLQKPGFHSGLHALMYSPASLDHAVKVGAISQKAADWARTKVKIYDRNSIKTMTRQELLVKGLAGGLNATQTADSLYRNSIRRIPFIGRQWQAALNPLNKWIFDRITPGIISESFVANMERLNQKNRGLSMEQQIREVVRDMNVFYGNLGRQGVFKNPNTRDLAQIFLLAPLWQEGLIGKELRSYSRVSGLSYVAGRRGLGANLYFGPLTRGFVRGLGAYFVLTQMANLAWRRKFTWQNEEPGHKLDARISINGEEVWISPMSVFGEVTHDLWRIAQTKPKFWDAMTQFGRNKLGPIGRLGMVLNEGKSPTGEEITTTGGVLGRAAQELAPAPISVGTYGRAIAHKLFPNQVTPTRPGQVLQRGLGAIGIKAQLTDLNETMLRRMADKFVRDNDLKKETLEFTPTDQASYAKLRGALRNNDLGGASTLLKDLRKHHTDEQILKAMERSSKRPFAGSKANEELFLYSLDNKGLDLYFKASMDRSELYQKFLQWYVTQPAQ